MSRSQYSVTGAAGMPATVAAASAVFTLSKAAWRVGLTLSTVNEDADIFGSAIKDLAAEVKSFGIECDRAHAMLENLISKQAIASPSTYPVDNTPWDCLSVQIEEATGTTQELQLFVKIVSGEETGFVGQNQRLRRLDRSKEKIRHTRTRVSRHAFDLRFTIHLVNMVYGPLVHDRPEHQVLDEIGKIQDMMQKLQSSSIVDPHSRLSHVEIVLLRYADEIIVQDSTSHERSHATESFSKRQSQPFSNSRVDKWVSSLKHIRQDQGHFHRSSLGPAAAVEGKEITTNGDSDDDLDTDLVKAALDTGAKAFEAQQWEDADSLLNEALRILQQLSTSQRTFCDIFDLHYKLSICAYHTKSHAEAEEALISLIQQPATSDTHRSNIYDATHLLSQLYIRAGEIDRAGSECEKALQARRRLLGKQSDAALESLALMAHIYVLQDNRALAKSCLSMIPEVQREAVLSNVETSLGPAVEHLDFTSLLTPSMSKTSPRSVYEGSRSQARVASPRGLAIEHQTYTTSNRSSVASYIPPAQHLASLELGGSSERYTPVANSSSAASIAELPNTERYRPISEHQSNVLTPLRNSDVVPASVIPQPQNLSRKEILDKVGCHPRDNIEEAVCASSDLSTFSTLLSKRKGFWRSSSLRKRARPERVTALHFAALFGEVEMALRLLDANFDINVVPFGYTNSLTPLHFAIGARQVVMVEFLIANGARPSEPDTWSTLAGQLMSRAWLMKTMSESERETVPHRILAIMTTLLKAGWDVNGFIDAKSRKSVLHQAVTFWTGSYKWDLEIRATVTEWLCERGADAFQMNAEGRTPWDLAVVGEYGDVLSILERYSRRKDGRCGGVELVELPGHKI